MTSLLGDSVPTRRVGFDAEKPFAPRLYALLNRPRYGKYQDSNGNYGFRQVLDLGKFKYHLRGFDTIAVSCVDGEKANFLAIDVDADFDRRLPIARDVLSKHSLDRAAFATSGSSPGRGKVVIALRNRLPQRQAVRVVQEIVGDLFSDPRFGKHASAEVSAYPQLGDGSHVRLLGRNLKRSATTGTLEEPLDLNGWLSDLYYVEPAELAAERYTRRPSALSAWAEAFISSPCSCHTGQLFKQQSRLAHEAIRLYGRDEAMDFLKRAFREVEKLSPQLSAAARRNLLRDDTVDRLVSYAIISAEGNYISSDLLWLPKSIQGNPRPVARVYEALCDYVGSNGLSYDCFGMTYERIAGVVGYAGKAKAYEAVLKAEDTGFLVRLDPGLSKKDGLAGLCGLYALVGNHNNPTLARAAGQATAMYQDRMKERLRRHELVAMHDCAPIAA